MLVLSLHIGDTRVLVSPVKTGVSLRAGNAPYKPFAIASLADGRTSEHLVGPAPSRRELLQWTALLPLLASLPAQTALPVGAAAGPSTLPTEARQALDKALAKITKSKAPVLVRLVFHDAGTYSSSAGDGGSNGSIRLELDRPENKGLRRGWRVIEELQASLKGTPAEGLVSSADLIPLAGAYFINTCGGPVIEVPIGRADADSPDPEFRLPSETLSAADLKASFSSMGLSIRDLVALSGSHTLGSKGYGDPLTFDNTYFKELLKKPWNDTSNNMADMIGIPSDRVIADDEACLPYIKRYAEDQGVFYDDFADAYVKLTSLGAKWRELPRA